MNKTCPLLVIATKTFHDGSSKCLGPRCAFYDENISKCAFGLIAEYLSQQV